MKVRSGIVLAALAALCAMPTASYAATASLSGGVLTIAGTDSENNDITVETLYNDSSVWIIQDDSGPNYETSGTLSVPNGCSRYTEQYGYAGDANEMISCPRASISKFVITLGNHPIQGYDTAQNVSFVSAVNVPAEVTGGSGYDIVHGTSGNDVINGAGGGDILNGDPSSSYSTGGNDSINGGPGDDSLYGNPGDDALHGNDGQDTVNGEDGNDQVHGDGGGDKVDGGDGDDFVFGGAGNDGGDYWVLGGDGSDVLDGGDGDDKLGGEGFLSSNYTDGDHDVFIGGAGIDETFYTSRNDSVKVTIDGVANDGKMDDAGNVVENDNVMPDVERVYGTYGNDILDGGPGGESQILIGLPGNDVILGRGGNDDIEGRGGADHLDGGDGDDKIYGSDGNDKLLGGNGSDLVEGGADDDDIEGGAGVDSFAGDTLKYQLEIAGNDTIKATDGVAEPVSCGAGSDTAFVDSTDTLAADPGNICEVKTVTAAPGGSVAGPGAGPGAVGPIDTKLGFAVAATLAQKIGAIAKAGAMSVPVEVAKPGKLAITAQAVPAANGKAFASAKRKPITIGKGSKVFTAPGRGSVKIKLSAKARKLLKRSRKATVTLKIAFTDSSFKTTKSTKRLKLKK